jgi:hypothetical protein
MNIKSHADQLAQALQVVAPDAPELQAYREACAVEWVKAPDVCETLHIAPRTLVRWRQDKKIQEGIHWNRLGISGHCIYNVPAIAAAMGPVLAAKV